MVDGVFDQEWREREELIEAFELAWTPDVVPELADFLPTPEHHQFHGILLELVRVDLELRWQYGHVKSLEDYRVEFPQLLGNSASLSLIAFEEFRARRQAGESVTADDYARRFGILTDNWPVVSISHDARQSESIASLTCSARGGRANGCTSSDTEEFPHVGTAVLSFFLQSELGRGNSSRVYLARQGDLAHRLVVLKCSAESFAEADKLAQLQHANIVPIYSVHRVGNLSAVCMPYFGATTLADVVGEIHRLKSLPASGRAIVETLTACGSRTELPQSRVPFSMETPKQRPAADDTESQSGAGPASKRAKYEGRLKVLSGLSYVEAILWIGAKLADGLNHAHERGILHRDLKPANVLLADDGQPMLLDFHLSADMKQSADIRERLIGGTLPYMAPEQIAAFQQRIDSSDARSDIYSLGVILFELLSGRNPFPACDGSALGTMLASMYQDRRQSPPKLRPWNPAVTPAVEAIIHRCLKPDPADRYQTAAELHEDLERHLKQLPLRHAREPSVRERAHKWTRRHSWLTSITCVLLLMMGISLAVRARQEHQRIAAVEAEIDRLMKAGRQALDDDDADVAHGRFLTAWMKVQAEPSLVDHQTGVAGWLDHSRRAVIQRQWKQRVPPRDFDDRRDEALLLSLLLEPPSDQQISIARAAIRTAIDLTIPEDPGWTRERQQLTLVESDLIGLQSDTEQALKHLDGTSEFSSRLFHERRAVLLEQLGRDAEADGARHKAEQFPVDAVADCFLSGVTFARQREFDLALQDFEHVLDVQPESFPARFFQALCFLHLNRPGEAKVALTSCLAQRPHFMWSRFFRSQASVALGDEKAAIVDLQCVLDTRPSGSLGRAAVSQMKLVCSQ